MTMEECEEVLELLHNISANARVIPGPFMDGATDCYCVPLDDVDAIREFLEREPVV